MARNGPTNTGRTPNERPCPRCARPIGGFMKGRYFELFRHKKPGTKQWCRAAPRPMVVKVQVSLFTTEAKRQVLIYDESREHRFEGDASEDVLKLMGRDPKAFFNATLKGTTFVLGKRTSWRDW
jgi:hypothetical protein